MFLLTIFDLSMVLPRMATIPSRRWRNVIILLQASRRNRHRALVRASPDVVQRLVVDDDLADRDFMELAVELMREQSTSRDCPPRSDTVRSQKIFSFCHQDMTSLDSMRSISPHALGHQSQLSRPQLRRSSDFETSCPSGR